MDIPDKDFSLVDSRSYVCSIMLFYVLLKLLCIMYLVIVEFDLMAVFLKKKIMCSRHDSDYIIN